jgi:putative peptidoglycan lipid II flippase
LRIGTGVRRVEFGLKSLIARLAQRSRSLHGNHRRIASGALWVGLFVLAAKLCVAAREMAIAWRYGIGPAVDAYQFSLTIVNWLPMMLSGVAVVVLVPRFVALAKSPAQYRHFVAELNGTLLLLGGVVALLTWASVPAATDLLTRGLDPATAALTRQMSRWLAPLAMVTVLSGYLSARLQARESYAYSFVEAVPAILIAAFVIAAPAGRFAEPLILGTLIGFLLQLIWLAQMTHRKDRPLGRLSFRHRHAEWAGVAPALLVMALGQIVITSTIPIDQAFAASVGDGTVAILGYANRIIGLLTALGYVVFARALLPVLSGVASRGEYRLGRSQSANWSAAMLALGVAVTAIGWLVAPFVVRILFERGAFTAEDTELVAHVLRYGLLQMGPFFGATVLVQWFAATGRFRALLIVNMMGLAVKVAFNALLVGPFGAAGIMASTAIMYAVIYGLILLLMKLASDDEGEPA